MTTNQHIRIITVRPSSSGSEGVLAIRVTTTAPPKASPKTPLRTPVVRSDAATIAVAIRDEELARKTTRAIANALSSIPTPPPFSSVVHLRARKALDALTSEAIVGAVVIVSVSDRNPSRLPAFVDALRDAGAAGIQLVWDGETPSRDRVEQHVFAALERGRAKPNAAPVVLEASKDPSLHLRFLIEGVASRNRSHANEEKSHSILTKGPIPC